MNFVAPLSGLEGSSKHSRKTALLSSLVVSLLFISRAAGACPKCATSDEVWSQIAAHEPGATLAILTFAFGVVGVLIIGTTRLVQRGRLLLGGSLLLGAGLGAFLDGIVLHQVLQWHAMVSSVVFPGDLVSSKVNMFWDGIFHLYAWVATVVAVGIVVRESPALDTRTRHRAIAGGALAGFGFFNVVEGTIDHHLFGLHHVHPGANELLWDIGFLMFGALLIAVGASISFPGLRGRRETVESRR